jgi:uncharacterized paraquat-inducible protein A
MEINMKIIREGKTPDDFPITCPKCGHSFRLKFAEAGRGNTVECPSCQAEITFSDDGFKSIGKAFDELRDAGKE